MKMKAGDRVYYISYYVQNFSIPQFFIYRGTINKDETLLTDLYHFTQNKKLLLIYIPFKPKLCVPCSAPNALGKLKAIRNKLIDQHIKEKRKEYQTHINNIKALKEKELA